MNQKARSLTPSNEQEIEWKIENKKFIVVCGDLNHPEINLTQEGVGYYNVRNKKLF